MDAGLRGKRQRRAPRLVLLAVTFLLFTAAEATAAEDHPFYGVSSQLPLGPSDVEPLHEAGVESVRLFFNWSAIEKQEGAYDFSEIDQEMRALAEARIEAMPFVYATPRWLEPAVRNPPLTGKARSAWRKLLRELVNRYGRGGTFIEATPGARPIKRWQIWNEPNLFGFWGPEPNPAAYAQLLRTSSKTIRAVDSEARIVVAGLPPAARGIPPTKFLRKLVGVNKIRRHIDFVGLHPYSTDVRDMITKGRELRAVLDQAGMEKARTMVTEFGWASSGYPNTSIQTLGGQAEILEEAYDALVERRQRWNLKRVYWFAWQDRPNANEACPFCPEAGLLDSSGAPKPSWHAFRKTAK